MAAADPQMDMFEHLDTAIRALARQHNATIQVVASEHVDHLTVCGRGNGVRVEVAHRTPTVTTSSSFLVRLVNFRTGEETRWGPDIDPASLVADVLATIATLLDVEPTLRG